MEVRERIEAVRKHRKWSRATLGEKLGTNRVAVWRHETGVYLLTTEDAKAYARALRVSVAALYGEAPLFLTQKRKGRAPRGSR
jgi:DNA-binding XRE family transcriptional regulator